MSKKVAVFWPGDYRAKPNEWALPQAKETTRQLVAALTKLGRAPYLIDGFLTRPDQAIGAQVLDQVKRKRILALMLGDTSMGMINGYFGPRLLYPIGFSEHKVDQAWLFDRSRSIGKARVDEAFEFVKSRGVQFHWGEPEAEDFTPDATRTQLRLYLTV